MVKLSERERIIILMIRGWGDRKRSFAETKTLFNAHFRNQNNQISKSTALRTVKRFEETGAVKNRPRPGRPKSSTLNEKQLDVTLSFVENPHLSTRQSAQHHDISHMAVDRILKTVKFHPYKITLIHELNDEDVNRRIKFCDNMMTRIDNDPNFLNCIVFSDEATFELNGRINRHNCRYWSDSNPHWAVEAHTQYPQKLNVWAGILNSTIIGPFFIDGNLNASKYEDMLRNEVVPAIKGVVGTNFADTWFQQDGAGPHYGKNVRLFLNVQFPQRWIGRGGKIEWPARSPDLSPLDYFLWGHLKSRIYQTQPNTLDDLRHRILDEIQIIEPNVIRNAVAEFYYRIGYCQIQKGAQFEHLL